MIRTHLPRRVARALVVAIVVLAPQPAPAQNFVDVSVAAGFAPYASDSGGMAMGVAAADYDGDGLIDIFLPTREGDPDRLYRNLGDGTFVDVAAAVGVAATAVSRAALWFDYDGDGDLDLLVAGDCTQNRCSNGDSGLALYRQNPDGTFSDVTVAAGLFEDAKEYLEGNHRGGLAAGDLDNDGYLDLYAGMWGPEPGSLYFNQGDGTFLEVGIGDEDEGNDIELPSDWDWQTVMNDFDGDGFLDMFVAVDFEANRLWLNQGDRTFVDVAPNAGADSAFNEMGVAIGDCDNDGDFDLYVTNVHTTSEFDPKYNLMLRNDWAPGSDCHATPSSDPCFAEIANALGIENSDWGWGTTFIDGDNGGLLDIAATNGFSDEFHRTDPSRYFMNTGGATLAFADQSAAVGMDDTDWGSALVAFDFDRDGDLDLLQTTVGDPAILRLRENQLEAPASPADHYLNVLPRSAGPNSHAIGAVVRARTGATTQSRLITAGISLLGQEPAEAFFGLGAATVVDELTIEWPDGVSSRFDAVAAGRLLPVRRGAPADLAVTIDDGVAETTDPATLTYAIAVSNLGAGAVTAALIDSPEPAGLSCTWQCAALGGSCGAGPTGGAIADEVDLLAGGSLAYTVECAVGEAAGNPITRTVTALSPGESPDPAQENNHDTDVTVALEPGACGESEHRYLTGLEVTAAESIAACSSILVGEGVVVTASGDLGLSAPVVGFESGVSVTGAMTVAALP